MFACRLLAPVSSSSSKLDVRTRRRFQRRPGGVNTSCSFSHPQTCRVFPNPSPFLTPSPPPKKCIQCCCRPDSCPIFRRPQPGEKKGGARSKRQRAARPTHVNINFSYALTFLSQKKMQVFLMEKNPSLFLCKGERKWFGYLISIHSLFILFFFGET